GGQESWDPGRKCRFIVIKFGLVKGTEPLAGVLSRIPGNSRWAWVAERPIALPPIARRASMYRSMHLRHLEKAEHHISRGEQQVSAQERRMKILSVMGTTRLWPACSWKHFSAPKLNSSSTAIKRGERYADWTRAYWTGRSAGFSPEGRS